jgi:hypothetical protein
MAARRKKKNRLRAKGLMLTKIISTMVSVSTAYASPLLAADRFGPLRVLRDVPSPTA